MALTTDEMRAIKELVADPIERTNREANARIEAMLKEHALEHTDRLDDHDKRIKWLESMLARALLSWSIIVAIVTLVGKYIWERWIAPLLKIK